MLVVNTIVLVVNSSILSLTSTPEGVGGQLHALATLPPGRRPVTHLYRRVGGAQDRFGRAKKISLPSGFGPRTMQAVAGCYTG